MNLKKKCKLGLLRRSNSTLFNSFFGHSYNAAISFCTIFLLICPLFAPLKEKNMQKACIAQQAIKKQTFMIKNVVDETAVISLREKNPSKNIFDRSITFYVHLHRYFFE